MVPPRGDAAGLGGPPEAAKITPGASIERLQRRNAALQRQLEARIAQVGDLRALLEERERAGTCGAVEVEALRARAAEYDALMATMTMRVLRRPRAWYAEVRRRLPALAGPRPGRQ